MALGENQGAGFFFVGNRLCLDFVNTRVAEDGRLVDLLGEPSDLRRWLSQAGVFGGEEAEGASEGWDGDPRARRVFGRALALREDLRGIVEAISDGESVRQGAIEEVNALLRARTVYPQIERTPTGFQKRFRAVRDEPLGALVPIAESAADLLAEGDPSLLKKCENPNCVLHFYDTSKNHARRWCSMSGCGNRMKAQAHYRRRQRSARP